MKRPTPEEQAALIRQRAETGKLLDKMRRQKLRNKPFDWREVDALLELGDHCGLPSRTTSGMIEMQRLFMKLRESGTGTDSTNPRQPG